MSASDGPISAPDQPGSVPDQRDDAADQPGSTRAGDGSGQNRSWRSERQPRWLVLTAVCVVVFAVLGAAIGVVWTQVADAGQFTIVEPGRGSMGGVDLAKRFGPVGWFILLGAGTGLIAGLALGYWLRGEGAPGVVVIVVSSLVGAVVCWQFGLILRPDRTSELLGSTEVGGRVDAPFGLGPTGADTSGPTYAALGSWPLGAVFGLFGYTGWRYFRDRTDPGPSDPDRPASQPADEGHDHRA